LLEVLAFVDFLSDVLTFADLLDVSAFAEWPDVLSFVELLDG
jgi:hypothetical protein